MDGQGLADEELSRRLREGDAGAFEALLRRYSQPIYNFALRMLGDAADAEDAAQHTFVEAFEKLPWTEVDAPIRPWLYKVARNKCIDLIRRRRVVPLVSLEGPTEEGGGLDPPALGPLPEELYERAELQQLLGEAIATLAERSREVVVMRYVGELTFAEIGLALGMPENTAKTLFQRAKGQLRAYLRKRL